MKISVMVPIEKNFVTTRLNNLAHIDDNFLTQIDSTNLILAARRKPSDFSPHPACI